ncbi:MAG: glycosyltransferase [Bacteroidales bacterium]|nr:glycosyltransferase [Bacteroidales bacterium]
MHILIVASWYKNAENLIAGSFIEEQARMLQRRGHTVAVLHAYINGTFRDTLSGRKELYSEENDNGILTMRLATNVYVPKIRQLSYSRLCRKALKHVWNYIRSNGKIDVIHSHAMFMGGVVANHISRKLNIPYFHTEHTSGFIFYPEQYTSTDIQLAKKVYGQSWQSFFVSHFAKERIAKLCGVSENNCSVLHNVVSPLFFEENDSQKFDHFTFLVIGCFIPRKNFDITIEAWSGYVRTRQADKLIIVGDGPLKLNIENSIKTLNLTDSVKMLPRQSREATARLMHKSHVVLSASSIETFGMTLAEALAGGIPVISTNSGGVTDIVNSSNGILLGTITAEAIEKGMAEMREKYSSFKPVELRNYANERFSEEAIYKQLIGEYNV